jgi:hypothetical protein
LAENQGNVVPTEMILVTVVARIIL